MKSTLNYPAKKRSYPWLGEFDADEDGFFVVLFTAVTTGVVVHSTSDSTPVGFASETWGESDFSEFREELILSNDR